MIGKWNFISIQIINNWSSDQGWIIQSHFFIQETEILGPLISVIKEAINHKKYNETS